MENNHFLRFMALNTGMTVLLLALSFVMTETGVYASYFGQVVSWSLVFLMVVSSLVFYILLKSINSPKKGTFLKGTLLTKVGKLFACLAFVFWLLTRYPNEQVAIVLIFMAFYFLYSLFVLMYLFTNLRPNYEADKNAKNDDFTS